MELAHRRWIARLVRLGLVAAALVIVATYLLRRVPTPIPRDLRIQSEAPTAAALGPGDVQIVSRDSAVSLILSGDKVLAGLSPKTIAKVRAELEASSAKDDTTGLGGSIAKMVKKTVADRIGTHVVYPLADMRDIRYDGEEIVIERKDGKSTRLFDNTKVNREPLSKAFSPEDARRFVEAVRARLNATR